MIHLFAMSNTSSDYDRIARAIAYIQQNVTSQPELADVARHVNLSPFHFQRLFTRWAGTTPKRFLQVLTLELGKNLLNQDHSIFDAADRAGLSSASRLHDHFVQIEAMTPGEYKNQGEGLTIHYGVHQTMFGVVFVARTPRGVCRATFLDEQDVSGELEELRELWPKAQLKKDQAATRDFADMLFSNSPDSSTPIKLHVGGTNFQLAVWRALLRIPVGQAVSYGDMATRVGNPKASRAVGSAIGANPVAFLIPCHRVIQQSGALGGYRWGTERKQAIQLWERL